jgi:DNA-binding GntR family transcriptional regulator
MTNGKKAAATRDGRSVDRVLRELRSRIVRGVLSPGEQIRQEDMAEELGVSRVPLREALNILADQGLLAHRRNQGYFVAKRVPEELFQMHRMLELLERELMKAIAWPSADQIHQLRDLNRQMGELVDRPDWTEMIALNRAFHFVIFGLSTYKIIFREVERLWTMTDVYIAWKLSLPEARRRTVDEHEQIITALVAQDRKAAQSALDVHRSNSIAENPVLKLASPVAAAETAGAEAPRGSRLASRG